MKRLTTDTPKDNIETSLNLFYVKDGWTWIRGGGPAPDYADISLNNFVRMLVKANIPDNPELPENDDDLSMMMAEWLMDDPASAEGIIALLYTAGWAFAELRHRLAHYEGLEEQGRLMALPCPMGSPIYMIVTKNRKDREPFSFIKVTELMESNVFRVCREYGKTVFLTRKEAKRALEGQKDG